MDHDRAILMNITVLKQALNAWGICPTVQIKFFTTRIQSVQDLRYEREPYPLSV